METLLRNIIYSSIQNFFSNDNDFFSYTSQTNMTEWNLSHHLCNELSKYIFWLNNDLDVTKRNYENRRPDIIFHKRRTNTFNLLVIEVKKNRNDKRNDINKIKNDWMSGTLKYRFGAYINIWDINEYEALLITKNGVELAVNKINSEYISPLDIKDLFKNDIIKIMDEMIISSENELLEEKLDNAILEVFS